MDCLYKKRQRLCEVNRLEVLEKNPVCLDITDEATLEEWLNETERLQARESVNDFDLSLTLVKQVLTRAYSESCGIR